MLAPTALELEEAKRIKQEEMIRDYDLWDDPAKSNEILVKLADSVKVVEALKDLKYKVMCTRDQFKGVLYENFTFHFIEISDRALFDFVSI